VRRAGFDEDWICPAVYAGRQFSWTSRINRTLPRPRDLDAWHRAQSVARMALLWGHLQHVPDYSRGATHYHSIRVRPSWSLRMREVARIGRHRFYRDGTS
jgi:spore germination cell wall hydrolase CwlJ-like protein